MAKNQTKKKRKAKVAVRSRIRRKREAEKAKSDSLRRVQGRPPADVGPTIRIKVRKKKR